MKIEFKHNIGDKVILKIGRAESSIRNRVARETGHQFASFPKVFTVDERISQECCGGVQLFYLLRSGETVIRMMPEDDILAFEANDLVNEILKDLVKPF